MTKILGLDLGTNSIGWALVTKETNPINGDYEELISLPQDTENEKFKGVLVFPEGVKDEKGNKRSRAAERTGHRSARRLKFRRKLRKYETLKVLEKNGLCPIDKMELEEWRMSKDPETDKKQSFKKYPTSDDFLNWLKTDEQNNKNPYYFRDKFSRKKYDWENDKDLAHELGRAFYHMAQRRGFSSNKAMDGGEDAVELLRGDLIEIINNIDSDITLEEVKDKIYDILEVHDDSDNKKQDNEGKKLRRIIKNTRKVLDKKVTNLKSLEIEIRKIITERKNLGIVKQEISELNDLISEAGCKTLGQYFYNLYNQDRHALENKIRTRHTSREDHYKAEFNQICEVQGISGGTKEALRKAIFYQRPLKSQKGLLGKCTFEGNKPRCPISHPDYEAYRMWSFINNIKIQTPADEKLRPLSEKEKERILPKFFRVSKAHFPFHEIADEIFPKGKKYIYYRHPDAKNHQYKINYQPKSTVSGCPVTAGLMRMFGKRWEEKSEWRKKLYESWKTKTYKNGQQRTEDDVVHEFWHALYYSELLGDRSDEIGKSKQEKLQDFAERNTSLNTEQTAAFTKVKGLKKDYARLSLQAIRKILPWMKDEGLIYPHAVFMANMDKVVDKKLWNDPNSRINIKDGLKEIVEGQGKEIKMVNAVNAQLADIKKNGGYSEPALKVSQNELGQRLEEAYGKKTWNALPNKQAILAHAFSTFEKQAKLNNGEGKYLKKQREDEAVKSFLLGNNKDGEIYCSDEKRLEHLYHPSDIDLYQPQVLKKSGEVIIKNGKPLKGLGSPMIPSIKNPVVMRTLHQLRALINELLIEGTIDHKTKIHIELARELNDANKRAAIERYQREREKQRELYREKIRELYKMEKGVEINPTDDDVLKFSFWLEQDPHHEPPVIIAEKDVEKYQYWDEQNHKCLYTGNSIGISDFIGPNPKYDIEHTVPRSVSYDNSQSNKTLCALKFNREVKKDSLPCELSNHQDILARIEPWKNKYLELESRIEDLVKKTKAASEKDKKDKLIQERHYLTMHRDYWKDKYERFTMKEVKAGFKNSQKVDTGTITKYARLFLGSVFKNRNGFPNVFAVNGSMVDQFRKAWGLHEKELDENGEPKLDTHGNFVFKKKDRSNHVNHCQDAVTVACMTREKYDKMAHAWRFEDKGDYKGAREALERSKPWDSFAEDVKSLKNKVLIVHKHKDNLPKQTKKKERVRGKIQYLLEYDKDDNGKFLRDENGKKIPKKYTNGKLVYKLDKNGQRIPKYQQGDTARGSLHKMSFYGAIKQPKRDDQGNPKHTETGAFILEKDKKGKDVLIFVIRKSVSELEKSEIDKIIDPRIKQIIKEGRKKEAELNKKIKRLQKQLTKADEQSEEVLKNEIDTIKNEIADKIYVIPPKKGKSIYTPIRKVRIKAHVSEPLPNFKEHRDKKKGINGIEKHPHKKWIYVANDDNYCLAIYENAAKTKRSAQIVNLMDAANYFKLSNNEDRREYTLVEPEKRGLPIKGFLKPGTLVLFYEENPEELWDLENSERRKRLYFVRKFSKNGQTAFQYHQEARTDEQLKEDYEKTNGEKAPKWLTNGKSKIEFDETPVSKYLLSPVNMSMLIEGVDFEISSIGKIQPI